MKNKKLDILLIEDNIADVRLIEQLLKTSEEYRNIFVKRFDIDIDKLLLEGT